MLSFLLLPDNVLFLSAAAFVGAMAAAEVILVAFGASFDALMGQDGGGPDAEGAGGLLAWLGLGRVPFSAFLVTLAAGFAGCGFALQGAALASFGDPVPWPLAAPGALVACLPLTAYATAGLAHLVPREESHGAKREEVLGRQGIVVQGTATADLPAEARVPDARGRPLYVGVVPAEGAAPIPQGTRVTITGRKGISFVAEPAADAPGPALAAQPRPPTSGKAPR